MEDPHHVVSQWPETLVSRDPAPFDLTGHLHACGVDEMAQWVKVLWLTLTA